MIIVKNLSKTYNYNRNRKVVFKNINFKIKSNESVVFLGRNGSGKSTLIRILSGSESFDSGLIKNNLTISWPVALQGGFQGSLTGRENVVFVCKLYLGNRFNEIMSKIKFVKEFADIGKYFDLPIKLYSNGMRARLAFALSMSFDFNYYLLDEITAVGDIEFKKKCDHHIREKIKEKSNFIIVSNSNKNLDFINKVFILSNGSIEEFDDPKEGYDKYKQIML